MQSYRKSRVARLRALRRGDRIGAVAPASPFDRDFFFAGVAVLNVLGFEVVWSDDIFKQDRYLAGSDALRLEMIHNLFQDPTIGAVWSIRGGYGSMRLLPRLNISVIRENPKPFIGCSDITAMLNFFTGKCGMVTFHAPMIATLARADEQSVSSLLSALTENRSLTIAADAPRTIVAGRATGIVAGGNLSTLSHMIGTPFFPDFSGAVVFLEDVGEKPYRIDRMLTQLLLSGAFDRAAGICLGSFLDCGDDAEIRKVFEDRLSLLPIPVAAGFPIGHGMPNLTLPIGLEAVFDSKEGSLAYAESAVL